jgi:hypothetical protein
LNWIDLIVLHQGATIDYSYILFGCINKTIRIIADTCSTWILLRIGFALQDTDIVRKRGNLGYRESLYIVLVPWILALYHIGLLFSLAISWLSPADLSVLNDIAKAKSGFEVGYAACQFVIALLTLITAETLKDPSASIYGVSISKIYLIYQELNYTNLTMCRISSLTIVWRLLSSR